MKAVYKHELSSGYTSLTGFILGAVILLFAGIFSMIYNLKEGVTNFEYCLAGTSFILIILIPIVTMKTLAEERKQKTDKLLYSLHISMTDVVLGKYGALLTMLFVPVAVLCIYPLVLHGYGAVNLGAAYSSLICFFFMAAAFLAMGVFISSLFENQAVAAGVCFVVMLLNYFLSTLGSYVSTTAAASLAAIVMAIIILAAILWFMTKSGFISALVGAVLLTGTAIYYAIDSTAFEGLFADIIDKLSLYERFYGVIDGVFDLTSLVYYASVAAVFIFFTVQSMEKRRWSE